MSGCPECGCCFDQHTNDLACEGKYPALKASHDDMKRAIETLFEYLDVTTGVSREGKAFLHWADKTPSLHCVQRLNEALKKAEALK